MEDSELQIPLNQISQSLDNSQDLILPQKVKKIARKGGYSRSSRYKDSDKMNIMIENKFIFEVQIIQNFP